MKLRIVFAFLLVLVAPIAGAQVYKITDLGPLSPTGINTWAQVVGNLNGHAFVWTKWDGLQDLGLLPNGTFSRAAAINDLGTVAGAADGQGTIFWPEGEDEQCSNLTQPFTWRQRTGIQGLGILRGFGTSDLWMCPALPFYSTDMNALGQVVGYVGLGLSTTYEFGFLWTKPDGMSLFGGSWPPTRANAISNTGHIVGQSSDQFFVPEHAALWTDGVMTDLGTLNGMDHFWSSSANGVNDLGQVVGWSTTSDFWVWSCLTTGGRECPDDRDIHAVLWSADGGVSDLGTLPGDRLSTASNINFFGLVVGSSGNTMVAQFSGEPGGSVGVDGRPFIWSKRSGMKDLNTLIPAKSGWTLNSATGINIWGQIVGTGTRNGQPHGFLLTPKMSF